MGKVIDIFAELRSENPSKRSVDLRIFADALQIYREAAKNVEANGAVVSHPRTGAPIENPYLKIQTVNGAVLSKMSSIKSDKLMLLLDAEMREKTIQTNEDTR